jgi:hypothetical protein
LSIRARGHRQHGNGGGLFIFSALVGWPFGSLGVNANQAQHNLLLQDKALGVKGGWQCFFLSFPYVAAPRPPRWGWSGFMT